MKNKITDRYESARRDTVKMTLLSMLLQAAGLVFNAAISRKAGTAAVGIMSLIFSFFGCITVLANGNIFISTSKFVSEEKECGGSVPLAMKRSFIFSLILSGTFSALCFIFSQTAAVHILRSPELGAAVRMISFSLVPAAAGSCIKGYFHGLRRVEIPMKGDTAEFIFKWLCMGILFLMPFDINFYVITSASILAGETLSFIYYLAEYIKSRLSDCSVYCIERSGVKTLKMYLGQNIPIVLGGYVQMIMSAANDIIVPAELLAHSPTADDALSKYGMFEAMIIPAVFFPASAMGSMSSIMISEAAAAAKAGGDRPRRLVSDSLKKAFSYSFFISGVFFCFGRHLGNIICPADGLVGKSLVTLAPVIPFIYLEIIMEGILKGMGKQNFCTVNSLAEYIIRIACVLIFVPKVGFGGIIISYYASNCASNIVRITAVLRASDTPFDINGFILFPMIKSVICCAPGVLASVLLPFENELAMLVTGAAVSAAAYIFMSGEKNTAGEKCSCGG